MSRLNLRIGRDVVRWLDEHPDFRDEFWRATLRLVADELTLVRHSFPVHDPGLPHMQRGYFFAASYFGVFEWKHAERLVRVHACRRASEGTPAA